MLYLFSNVYIDFDYKQNIKDSNAIIISKEFGSYNYSKDFDSLNLNISSFDLHDRLFVSSQTFKNLSDHTVNFENKSLNFLEFLQYYTSAHKKDLIIYLDSENYAIFFCWFLKSFLPNMTKDVAYEFYYHAMICMLSLEYLQSSSYIIDKTTFFLIYEDTQKTSVESSWTSKVNFIFKFATLSSTYTLDQIEEMKSLLIKQVKEFYTFQFQKLYRKLVENFYFFESTGNLYKENNKVKWKICENKIIEDLSQIDYTLISYIFENDSILTDYTSSAMDIENVGEISFKTIYNLKHNIYDNVQDESYKGVINADLMHFFFLKNNIEKFNPVSFVKFCASADLNSDFFSSSSFPGNLPFLASFVSKLIRENSPDLNCFCLNKL